MRKEKRRGIGQEEKRRGVDLRIFAVRGFFNAPTAAEIFMRL